MKPMEHTAHDTIGLLKSKFGERVVSRNDPFNWPLRSCDLTTLEVFSLWFPQNLLIKLRLNFIRLTKAIFGYKKSKFLDYSLNLI